MMRQPENLQPSLFEDAAPRAVLAAGRIVDLTVLVEAMLREIAIAIALTNGESSDEQDHD